MRGIAHAHVLSVAGRVAFWLGQHGPAERAVQTAYYWEWLRAGPTDTDDDKDGADAPGWHAHVVSACSSTASVALNAPCLRLLCLTPTPADL